MYDHGLAQRLQGLPQELFDNIHDLVFTVTTSNRVDINRTFHLPAQSRVSKATRKHFIDSYYRNSTFVFTENIAYWWGLRLGKASFEKISRIEIMYACGDRNAEDSEDSEGDSDIVLYPQLSPRQWRLKAFVGIMERKGFCTEDISTEPISDDEHPSELRFFFFGDPDQIDHHWAIEQSPCGTVFTKVAGSQ